MDPQPASSFAALVQRLSEPGGDFDTDNLISNERSYLHVIPALKAARVVGGAYVGVGPDQNFSYIAQVRPTLAFIVDVRRDNLLLHLLFKALFAQARNRAEYICLLMGRTVPDRVESWQDAALDKILAYIDGTMPNPTSVDSLRRRLDDAMKKFGIPLAPADLATVDRFHRTFIKSGLSLQFESRGRPPRSYYPTYRELLLETDRDGQRWSFLASERDFQFVRALQARDGVVPVVGDFGGPHAIRAIGALLAERRERISAFYVSNVEMYIFRDGGFARFAENLSHLPRDRRSSIIRSIFGGYRLPESVPGYYSTSLIRPLDSLVDGFESGRIRSYSDLVEGVR